MDQQELIIAKKCYHSWVLVCRYQILIASSYISCGSVIDFLFQSESAKEEEEEEDFVIIRDETMSPEAPQAANLNLTTSLDDEEQEEEQVLYGWRGYCERVFMFPWQQTFSCVIIIMYWKLLFVRCRTVEASVWSLLFWWFQVNYVAYWIDGLKSDSLPIQSHCGRKTNDSFQCK